MTDATAYETDPSKLVDKAAGWAMALWRRAERESDDGKERAMHRAATWAKVSPGTLWKLRYRKPSEIGVSIYFKLEAAHARLITSVEARVAANLEELRQLPATPSRERLVAGMEEYLRHSGSSAFLNETAADFDQSRATGTTNEGEVGE